MLDHHGNGEWSSNIGTHCGEVNDNNNTSLDVDGRRKKKNDKKEPGVKFTIAIVVGTVLLYARPAGSKHENKYTHNLEF